jgi:DNA-binding NarL/FixJ family response regulator
MRRVEMVETFADGPSLIAALETLELPDYLLVDMEFQGEPTGGLMITRRVHERYPEVKIIIFSGRFDNPLPGEQHRERRVFDIGRVVMEALSLGANAFVSKNAVGGFSIENILRAIACLERGEQCYFNYPVMLTIKEAAERYFDAMRLHDPSFALSDTERRLLLLEAAGCTASEISDRLGESDKAIQERQKDLSRRLGIVNKAVGLQRVKEHLFFLLCGMTCIAHIRSSRSIGLAVHRQGIVEHTLGTVTSLAITCFAN